ncbi:unnamed protein product [Rotaria socialis]
MIQQKSHPHVRDDTIFIKIIVDVGDMSKTLMYYQQLLIKKEEEALLLSQQSIETDRGHDNSNSRQIADNLDFDLFTSIFTFDCLITSLEL